jgi:hypothetical protein
MRARFLPPFVAGLGVALWLSSSASATTPITIPSETTSNETGSFTNYYTFTLTSGEYLEAFDTVVPLPTSTFNSGVFDLYLGSPITGTLVNSISITGSPSPSGTLKDVLGAGSYYYMVAVSAKGSLVNVLSVSAIPELETWAMLGLGFAALGFVGFAKRKGERRLFVD